MSCADQRGCACTFSAATPATWGAAIEVPDFTSGPLPVPTPADTVDTPGAVTLALRPESPVRGPPELKEANWV